MTDLNFSVVIPLYQKRDTIVRAVSSVLNQTCPNFELIVVDDGSTDGGFELIEQLNDNRIRIIRQPNQGVSEARNTGIRNARNEFVAFLDADDEWLSIFLDEMARLIQLYPNCGWYSGRCIYKTKGKEFPQSKPLEEGVYINFFQLATINDVVHSSTVVIPQNIALEVGGFPSGVSTGEDIIMWIKIASKWPVAYSPKDCAIYHFDESNIIKRIRFQERDIFHEYLENGNDSKNEFLAMYAIHQGILHSIYGNRCLAKQIEHDYSFTRQHIVGLNKLKKLNKTPITFLFLYYNFLSAIVKIKRTIVRIT